VPGLKPATNDEQYLLSFKTCNIFVKRSIEQTVYAVCTRINYKIVHVTSLNKCLHCGKSATE